MDALTLEYILTGIFLGGVGIVGLIICATLATTISKQTIDTIEILYQGPPEGISFSKPPKLKDDDWKSDPLPIENITAGSMF
jgi:hypothetical protein